MRLSAHWCRNRLFAFGLVALGVTVLGGVSCKPKYAPEEPVKMATDGCCKFANEKMTKFAGCRLTHRCTDEEPIWIRGAVNCTAVDEDKCFGGRCCEFQPLYGTPGSPLNWDDGSDKPASEPPTNATPDSDAPPAAQGTEPAPTTSAPTAPAQTPATSSPTPAPQP
jgi:hypothetical protein